MMRDSARALASVLVLAFIPLGYFGTMVRRRRFSLSWMMLAPPVVLSFLIVWNSSWANEPSLVANFLSGVGLLASGSAIYVVMKERDARDFLWGKGWLFVSITATLFFAFLLGFEYVQADDPAIRYVFTWQDAALLLVGSVCLAGQLYWVARFVRSVWSWRGRRRRKALA